MPLSEPDSVASEHDVKRGVATADNASRSPHFAEDRIQFTLNEVLAVVWVLSAMLGAWRIHWVTIPLVGLPVAMLGVTLLLRRPLLTPCMCGRISVAIRLALVLIPVVFALWMYFSFGRPGNAQTWILVIAPILWAMQFALAATLRRVIVGMVFIDLLFAWIWFDWLSIYSPWVARDTRNGRIAWSFGGAKFIVREQNTTLLEHYVGSRDAAWREDYRKWNGGSSWLGLIGDEEFPQVLAVLPHEAARRQVILCLTEPTNHFRFHQALLLTSVYTYGLPPHPNRSKQYDALSWWEDHADLFHPRYHAWSARRAGEVWLCRLNPQWMPHSIRIPHGTLLVGQQWKRAQSQGRYYLQSDDWDAGPSEPLDPASRRLEQVAWWWD